MRIRWLGQAAFHLEGSRHAMYRFTLDGVEVRHAGATEATPDAPIVLGFEPPGPGGS